MPSYGAFIQLPTHLKSGIESSDKQRRTGIVTAILIGNIVQLRRKGYRDNLRYTAHTVDLLGCLA